MITDLIDDSQCPLCQQPNQCALSAGKSAQNCWCQQQTVPASLLAKIPTHWQGKSCICQHCIDKASQLAREIR